MHDIAKQSFIRPDKNQENITDTDCTPAIFQFNHFPGLNREIPKIIQTHCGLSSYLPKANSNTCLFFS